MEDHVPILETCQRMKELGWKKETIHKWVSGDVWDLTSQSDYETPGTPVRDKWIPAPLATEIMEELPEEVQMCFVTVFGKRKTVKQFNCAHLYGVTITGSGLKYNESDFTDPNPAEALAQMWIYLKENDLLPTQPDDHEDN